MNRLLIALVSSIAIAGPASAGWFFADEPAFTCEAPSWSSASVDDDHFKGTVVDECRITGATGRSVRDFESNLTENLSSYGEVAGRPATGELDGLPAHVYGVTVRAEGLTMRQQVTIASDGDRRLVWEALSKDIQATGFAAFLKKTDSTIEILPDATPGEFRVLISNLVHIKKPPFVPKGTFKDMTAKATVDQLVKTRDQVMTKLVAYLKSLPGPAPASEPSPTPSPEPSPAP